MAVLFKYTNHKFGLCPTAALLSLVAHFPHCGARENGPLGQLRLPITHTRVPPIQVLQLGVLLYYGTQGIYVSILVLF